MINAVFTLMLITGCGYDKEEGHASRKGGTDLSIDESAGSGQGPAKGGGILPPSAIEIGLDGNQITPMFMGGGGGGSGSSFRALCRNANMDCNTATLTNPLDRLCCEELGTVANYLPPGFKSSQRIDNIIVEGCGWAMGFNLEGVDFAGFINQLKINGGDLEEAYNDHNFVQVYANRFPVRFKELVEAAQGGAPINFIDGSYAVDSNGSPAQKGVIDDIIDTQYGGSLSGNTLVIYEFDPPDKFRALQTAYDRRDEWNPYASIFDPTGTLPGMAPGFLTPELYLPYPDPYGQVYFHPDLVANPMLQLTRLNEIVDFFLAHLQLNNTVGTTNPFIFPTFAPGNKTVMDFIINSNHKNQMSAYLNNKYGDNVQIWDVGAEDTYEGSFRHGAEPTYRAAWDMTFGAGPWDNICMTYPTFFTCYYSHPLASHLEEISKTWDSAELALCQDNGFVYVNSAQLFAGHAGRSNDPTSPNYLPADPTHWLSPAEINSIGQEQLGHMMFMLWKTGNPVYFRQHSSVVAERAEQFEFPATRKMWGPILPYP